MTLDEYRFQVVQKLATYREAGRVRSLLIEADLMLQTSGVSNYAKKSFWESLNNDLDVLAQDSARLLGSRTAAVLGAVIAAAQTAIAQYETMLGGNEATC